MALWPVLCLALVQSCTGFRHRKTHATNDQCSSIGCFADYNPSLSCQCNSLCERYNNCCSDFWNLCKFGNGNPDPTPAPAPPATGCSAYGCFTDYDRSRPCQCNERCGTYGNCCDDFASKCSSANPSPSPSPSPPSPPYSPSPSPGSEAYWSGVNKNNKAELQSRLRSGARKLSYGDLWSAYKDVWVDLPGKCSGRIFDVYSSKCWTPGSGQCGTYRKEGDCYNREHSWPKSWWNRVKNAAYSDMFHVMPSDGYVNGKRGSLPYCEVPRPSYTSSDGHKTGTCATGYSGSGFEPLDSMKGVMARGHLYMSVRYNGEFGCCDKEGVSYSEMKPWYLDLIMKWHNAFPPEAWERELNNRIQGWQGNRNPFIDFPELATTIFRR